MLMEVCQPSKYKLLNRNIMFGLFKKSSPKEKLEKKYKKLLEESHKLSTVNRMESDLKMFEASEVLKEIEKLEN